ncbi:C39 family peptidase [Hyphococcus formosus]|uniref:C39 family peptidase n=1 Tax=Hyphococcus formosus TaxID=3143534 RepID=UPI00398B74E8
MQPKLNKNRLGQKILALMAVVFSSFSFSAPTFAGDLQLFVGGSSPRVKVVSMAERKYQTVVKQQFDFSCGSAALATLLTYHYDRPTTEEEAFRAMWEVGDQERIRKLGFSLLEMKRYLESEKLKADGFVLTLDRIQEIGVPGIALIDIRGYKHFVVIKGLTKEVVLIGDPSSGVTSMPRHIFEDRWDGTILFIRSDVLRGKASFNRVADWRLAPSAPHDRALDLESLQSVSINQTRPSTSGFTINTTVESR